MHLPTRPSPKTTTYARALVDVFLGHALRATLTTTRLRSYTARLLRIRCGWSETVRDVFNLSKFDFRLSRSVVEFPSCPLQPT